LTRAVLYDIKYHGEGEMKKLKNNTVILLGFILIIALISCGNQDKKKEFAMKEEAEIELAAEEIIKEFGYNNFKIFTYFHKEMGQRVQSKSINSNKAVGSGLLPMFDQLTAGDSYSSSMTNDFDGYFEQRGLIVNYSYDGRQDDIVYDYLSIIIIFDDISTDQKNELLKLLNIYITNSNRGDIVYIISKNEMVNNK
jgi:uncharacterized lipoprotein YehR (DUF1307 family)